MADPHNKTGKSCSKCHTPFTAKSYVGTVSRRKPVDFVFDEATLTRHFIVPDLFCRSCHNEHFAVGEE